MSIPHFTPLEWAALVLCLSILTTLGYYPRPVRRVICTECGCITRDGESPAQYTLCDDCRHRFEDLP